MNLEAIHAIAVEDKSILALQDRLDRLLAKAKPSKRELIQQYFRDLYPKLEAHLASGKLQALAVTQPERSPLVAQVPTVGEAMGIMKDADFVAWYGLLLPARAPAEVVTRLQRSAAGVLEQPGWSLGRAEWLRAVAELRDGTRAGAEAARLRDGSRLASAAQRLQVACDGCHAHYAPALR